MNEFEQNGIPEEKKRSEEYQEILKTIEKEIKKSRDTVTAEFDKVEEAA
jgi:DNA-binding cell septation regulator SpoVG